MVKIGYALSSEEHRPNDLVGKALTCGPDPEAYVQTIREYIDAGYDHVYVHQIGPAQEEFFSFYEREVLPALR